MKTVIIFLCSLATFPDCYKDPEIIPINYESGDLCSKIENAAIQAVLSNRLIHPFDSESWMVAYDCGDGKIFLPLHDDDGMNE